MKTEELIQGPEPGEENKDGKEGSRGFHTTLLYVFVTTYFSGVRMSTDFRRH